MGRRAGGGRAQLSEQQGSAGIISRDETLLDDEVRTLRTLPVTTLQRTALDLARRGTVGQAVARLDALANATRTNATLVDDGAQSPKETWLRLLFVTAGFPRPRTQIPVLGPDGYPRYYLDMGWEEVMVAAEYDGEHHRIDRDTYTNDIGRSEYVYDVGWRVIRVVSGNRRAEIIERTRRAWISRRNRTWTSRQNSGL